MKLQYLVLNNIGPFHGVHTIDLTTDKQSTGYAFFAANGRGKTTIYNAMKWCLFGPFVWSNLLGNYNIEIKLTIL